MTSKTRESKTTAGGDPQREDNAAAIGDPKERSAKRRKMLGMIAAGGGVLASQAHLPQTWRRPVVDSVLLPAHAVVSPADTTPATQLGCVTMTCIVTGWAGNTDFMAGASSTTRQTTTSDGPNTQVGFITTFLTNYTPTPYTETLNRPGNFSGETCSGASVVSYTMSVPSTDPNKAFSFSDRVFTTMRATASSLERMTVQDLGQFIFTATCAMQTAQTAAIGP
jgi:hypothetical protein